MIPLLSILCWLCVYMLCRRSLVSLKRSRSDLKENREDKKVSTCSVGHRASSNLPAVGSVARVTVSTCTTAELHGRAWETLSLVQWNIASYQ